MQNVRDNDSKVSSVEAWMREMEIEGHLPGPQEVDHQLPAYSAIGETFTPPTMQTCCAFRKLESMNRSSPNYYELLEKSPQFRFISWVVLARTPDQRISEKERLTCPMVWCRASFHRDEFVELVNHLSGCSFLGTAEYNCPYHSRNELFAEPQLPRKPRPSKKRFLKNTLNAIVKLGTKNKRTTGRQSGAQSPSKRIAVEETAVFPRDKPGSVVEQPNRPELGTGHLASTTSTELDGQAVMATDPRELMPKDASGAKPSVAATRAAELPGAVYNLFEMEGQLPSEFLYDRAELSDKRFSYTSHSSEDFSTESSSPVSPVSPQMWYNTRDFDSPISPSDSQISDPWTSIGTDHRHSDAPSSSVQEPSRQNNQLGGSSGLSPSAGDWQQFGSKAPRLVPSIRVDTSVNSGKSVLENSPASSDPSSAAPTTSRHSLGTVPSPLQIEAESRDPKKLIEELRGLFNTLFKLVVAKIQRSPLSPAGTAILRSHISAAWVFDCGFKGLHTLFRGQVPQDFWQVFGISILGYACGLANSEFDLAKQFPAIYNDLINWSQAITNDGDRSGYLLLVKQLWSPNENCFEPVATGPWVMLDAQPESLEVPQAGMSATGLVQSPSWSVGAMAQPVANQVPLIPKGYQDDNHLLLALNNGTVAQLCKNFLNRYEYLSSDLAAGAFGSSGLDAFGNQSIGAAQNLYAIRNNILDPLSLIPGLEGFRPIVNNTSLLLENMPAISLRYLELMLLQEGKSGAKSQAIYKRFAEAVRRLCDQTAALIGIAIDRSSFHVNDIENIVNLHQDLLMQAHSGTLNVPNDTPSTDKGKGVASYSPTSEAESSVSHRPFSWQGSPTTSDSPATNPSGMFNSEFYNASDHSLMSFGATPPFVPSIPDDSHGQASSCNTNSPFQQSAGVAAGPTSQPHPTNTQPTSDPGEGTMTCKICGKVLAGKAVWLPSNMKRHMRELHTPAAKKLVCDVPGCGRAFLRNHNLAHHRKTVHGRGT